jgi:hypothetical protein
MQRYKHFKIAWQDLERNGKIWKVVFWKAHEQGVTGHKNFRSFFALP